ncbi:MAG: UDP-glucose 4-epimerase [Sphingomonadales bacterium]|jgi:UDP-glucose 4-epimerase|nr:UDP-glucose 4-epimerase [Sphingomonadales bacterium]
MATIWITGARGFIGRHLAKHLAGAGHRVAGVGHGIWPEADAWRWGVTDWLNADVDAASLTQLAATSGAPACVYHLAGGSSVGASLAAPLEDFRRTAASSAELLEWTRSNAPSAAVVAVSSAAVYGEGHSGPIDEDAATRPFSPYGFNKYAMEQLFRCYAQSFGCRIAIVRLFSIYGNGLTKQLLWDLCTRFEDNAGELLLAGSGEELRDWLHVDDVAVLLEKASARASPDVALVNGGRGTGLAVRSIVELVRAAWSDAPRVSFSGSRRPGDPFSLVAATRRLDQWGFRPAVAPERGIADYVAWFRNRRSEGA